jgi:hypothetical protein
MVDMAEIDQTEITNEIRDHIEGRIKFADLNLSPCPHMIIQEFFPQDVYKSLLDLNLFNLEEGHPWLPGYRKWIMRTRTPYYHLRKQIDLARSLDVSDRSYMNFWAKIRDCLLVDH